MKFHINTVVRMYWKFNQCNAHSTISKGVEGGREGGKH